MNREEIIKAAIRLEEDGIEFYDSAASRAPNELASRTFESFKKDEQNHISWLKTLSNGDDIAHDPEEVNAIHGTLRSIFADAPGKLKGKLPSSLDDIECIDIAIGKEEESITAYAGWAETTDDSSLRRLFLILVDAEKKHRELLSNAREYLDSTGDWFMGEEQWIFDGG